MADRIEPHIRQELSKQCTCKAFHGDNSECPWHGVEAMRAYYAKHPLQMPGDYE